MVVVVGVVVGAALWRVPDQPASQPDAPSANRGPGGSQMGGLGGRGEWNGWSNRLWPDRPPPPSRASQEAQQVWVSYGVPRSGEHSDDGKVGTLPGLSGGGPIILVGAQVAAALDGQWTLDGEHEDGSAPAAAAAFVMQREHRARASTLSTVEPPSSSSSPDCPPQPLACLALF